VSRLNKFGKRWFIGLDEVGLAGGLGKVYSWRLYGNCVSDELVNVCVKISEKSMKREGKKREERERKE
jgi:hypothetical protein